MTMRDARVARHLALTVTMGWLAVLLAWLGQTFMTSNGYVVVTWIGLAEAGVAAFWIVATVGVIGSATSNRASGLFTVLMLATASGVAAIRFGLGNPVSTGMRTCTVLAGLSYCVAWKQTDGRI